MFALVALMTGMQAATVPATSERFDVRCHPSYSPDAPESQFVDRDVRYGIDLERGVWQIVNESGIRPIHEINEAQIRLFPDFYIDRATGVISSTRYRTSTPCVKVDFTPMPVNRF